MLGIEAQAFAYTRRSARTLDGRAHDYAMPYWMPTQLRRGPMLRRIGSATHLLVESVTPLFMDPHKGVLSDEIDAITDLGVKLGVIFHGSDVRSPTRHLERIANSYFSLYEPADRERLEESAARNREAVGALGVPVFYSTPDLGLDVRAGTWLPLVVEAPAWQVAERPLQGRRPVVLHLPSKRTPAIKGTHAIEPQLERLARQGIIRYVAPEPTPHASVPKLMAACDVFIDQILSGSYGVSSVEGMAAGRLVLGHIAPDVAALMPEPAPIINVTEESLEVVLRDVARRPDAYRDIAARGPGFVERLHSGRRSADALRGFLES
jgi:hypothetical protein